MANLTITPQGQLYLCKTPLESDYKNQLTFANSTAQYNYFYGTRQKTYDNYTYIKKDNAVIVGDNIDTIIDCNYLFYKNTGFTNKYYYCFIKNMEYVNENATRITFETDCFQTWQFQLIYKPSFVEREHVSNDTLGLHTIPEGLELGPYIVNAHLADSYNNQLCIVMGMSEDYTNDYALGVYNYTGIPGPLVYYKFAYSDVGIIHFSGVLEGLQAGKADAIVSMFLCPTWIVPNVQGSTDKVTTSNTAKTQNLGISRIASLNGYTPTNKKLLTYPYCYIGLSNGVGQYNTYHQEDWSLDNNNEMVVTMYGSLTSGCSIRAVPKNYMGVEYNWDEGITLGKFPALAWANDIYTNWQTQNGVNLFGIPISAETAGNLKGIIKGTAGALTGDMGMLGSGAREIWDTMQESYHMDMIPAGVRGSLNSGDVGTSAGFNRLHAYRITIKQEYAKIIDGYFNMYGYKVNSLRSTSDLAKTIGCRRYWNYVKMIGCNVEGDIPQTDLEIIRAMFNNGVTLWHDATKMYDYSQSNTIVT